MFTDIWPCEIMIYNKLVFLLNFHLMVSEIQISNFAILDSFFKLGRSFLDNIWGQLRI